MSYEDIIGHPATTFDSKSYEELKAERDRYVEHIKSLVDERNRAFNREDDLKVLLRDVQNELEEVCLARWSMRTLERIQKLRALQERINVVLGPEWQRAKPQATVNGHVDVIGTYDCPDEWDG